MGRRSINTTKSGKYMNPTDQFRKEARKRELKKNKRQRMLVRQAVLKGKDPLKLLEEMEQIDSMEYNPMEAPKLNEKVLKDKRKKLKETFQRVLRLYDKENPEYAVDLKKAEYEYDKKRVTMQLFFEQVKNAERVQLDDIPLPDQPVESQIPSMIPLPNEMGFDGLRPVGILKKTSAYAFDEEYYNRKRANIAGPPPGPPLDLSDSEDEEQHDPPPKVVEEKTVDIDMKQVHAMLEAPMDILPHDVPLPDAPPKDEPPAKLRKIRFADDDTKDTGEEEKDTRLRLLTLMGKDKSKVSPLQVRMLLMAGQDVPKKGKKKVAESESDDEDESSQAKYDPTDEVTAPGTQDDPIETHAIPIPPPKVVAAISLSTPNGVPGLPPGAPPGAPPGPPPGAPPMFMRPPLRGAPSGSLPRMLPPGPPPGRPQGLPPGPPPGLPPSMRGSGPRMGPGHPGHPRMMRPPGMPGMGQMMNPNILSAPPSIMKPPLKSLQDDDKKNLATIEAKPQIKNVMGDVTRFMPTALKVKRGIKDAKGRVKPTGKDENKKTLGVPAPQASTQARTKDDAYDAFMKEMENLF